MWVRRAVSLERVDTYLRGSMQVVPWHKPLWPAGRRPPYFGDSSLILLPPFATGMTQIGVATSAELRSDV
jgi:hypothetical protein